MYHEPVLLSESLDSLAIRPDGIYVDCTFGGGGHSRAILGQLSDDGHLFAFDQDPDAWKNAPDDPRFTLIKLNFRHLQKGLRLHNCTGVNGILADLGVSSHQFDTPERGFSLRFDGPLDMRMNPSNSTTAESILRDFTKEEIAQILHEYGEVPRAHWLAKEIVKQRAIKAFQTTAELSLFLEERAPRNKEHTFKAQVFQALRIAVNKELKALEELLLDSLEVLAEGGRLVVISYHSLEDRIVKRFMREGWPGGEAERDEKGRRHFRFRPVFRKPIIPGSAEQADNNRARSAKLRSAERVEEWA